MVILLLAGLGAGIGVAAEKGDSLYDDEGLQTFAQIYSFIDPLVSKFTSEPFLAKAAARQQSETLKAQAQVEKEEAQISAAALRRENTARLGQEQLAFVRSGVHTSAGSPLEVLTSNALQRETNALNMLLQGANSSNILRTQGRNILTVTRFTAAKSSFDAGKQVVGSVFGTFFGGGAGASGGGAGTQALFQQNPGT